MNRALFWSVGFLMVWPLGLFPASAQVAENEKVEKLKEGTCSKVVSPEVIEVDGIGTLKLLGIHTPKSTEFGYEKALAAMQKFTENQTVRVEVCYVRNKNWAKQLRAVVYYQEEGNWYNLNTKMLRAGLASVVEESPCHLHTAAWEGFVREAAQNRHGIFHEGKQIPVTYRQPVASVPASPAPKVKITYGRMPVPPTFKYVRSTPDDVPVKYVGSIWTRRFHRLTCGVAPKEHARVYFPNRLQAIAAKYRPCLICLP